MSHSCLLGFLCQDLFQGAILCSLKQWLFGIASSVSQLQLTTMTNLTSTSSFKLSPCAKHCNSSSTCGLVAFQNDSMQKLYTFQLCCASAFLFAFLSTPTTNETIQKSSRLWQKLCSLLSKVRRWLLQTWKPWWWLKALAAKLLHSYSI